MYHGLWKRLGSKFELRTLGTKVERYDHCATRPAKQLGTPYPHKRSQATGHPITAEVALQARGTSNRARWTRLSAQVSSGTRQAAYPNRILPSGKSPHLDTPVISTWIPKQLDIFFFGNLSTWAALTQWDQPQYQSDALAIVLNSSGEPVSSK